MSGYPRRFAFNSCHNSPVADAAFVPVPGVAEKEGQARLRWVLYLSFLQRAGGFDLFLKKLSLRNLGMVLCPFVLNFELQSYVAPLFHDSCRVRHPIKNFVKCLLRRVIYQEMRISGDYFSTCFHSCASVHSQFPLFL
jgi:hypothetical protein